MQTRTLGRLKIRETSADYAARRSRNRVVLVLELVLERAFGSVYGFELLIDKRACDSHPLAIHFEDEDEFEYEKILLKKQESAPLQGRFAERRVARLLTRIG